MVTVHLLCIVYACIVLVVINLFLIATLIRIRTVAIGLALTIIPAKGKWTNKRSLRKHKIFILRKHKTFLDIHFFKWTTEIASPSLLGEQWRPA